MPGLFRDQAVALLARERLHEIRDELRAKRDADPARFSPIEARVLYLAEQATAVTNGAPPVPPDRFPGVFRTRPGETTSQYFTMGALGTTIPGFGSLFAPDQDWVYRVLRKGTRDERRERVDAQSARLAVETFRGARNLIQTSTLSDADKASAIAAARAFFLGHLCHVASGVVGAPLLDDMAWHLPGPPVTSPPPAGVTAGTDAKLSRENVEGQIDQLLKANLLQPSIVGSVDFASWLPSAREVPDQLYQAFADAIRALYLTGDTHKGFADLEAAFSGQAPEVSKDWIAEGFSTLRNVIGSGHDWGFWTWVGLLT
ncbi:MAG TPA: hypothetical protein VFT22_18435, partial [Kofleriaceae bacterium]|nr:hypothetical protein [Kofleriaceae bacterium]